MPLLTVQQLFQPAPSGVGPYGNVPLVPPAGSWLADMLEVAADVQLPTTSWQSGAPERTILAIQAVTFAESDVNISQMAQGGFLQSAASGTVTYTTTDGTNVTIPVTPDPSNAAQNPTGAPGWLDLLTANVYDVTRLQATYATGPLAIANLKGSTIGPFATGAYHVANVATGATYHNAASLTVPSSSLGSGGTVVGVSPGLLFTILTTSAPHGLTTGESVYLVLPSSTGISGLNGVFGIVTAVTTNTLAVNVSSSGTYVSGGTVYLCTVATMIADVAGIGGNAGIGSVTTQVTQNANVFVSNVLSWTGSNWESNLALASRAQLSLAIRSPNGPSQAYVYYAQTAQQILSSGVLPGGATIPTYTLTNGPVVANEFAGPVTGVVTTVVASQTPASSLLGANVTPGVSQLAVTNVSNANPAVVTTAGPTSLLPGQSMTVTISGVLGVAGVNGTLLGTYVSANTFSIPVNTIGAGTYAGGGSIEGGDLGQIDQLLQQNVVPDNTVAVTVSALALPITIVATVIVPQAYVATYKLAVNAQLQAQITSYAVGGNAPDFAVAYDDIIGALEEAGVLTLGAPSYVRQIQSLSLNGSGSGAGVTFPGPFYQAILAPPTITVLGV
jgi:hypothetical protein